MKRNRNIRRLSRAFVLLAIVLLGISNSSAQLRIYYIRHAEAGHNVKDEWLDVPEDEWPEYVGNPNMFTPEGVIQVIAASKKLKNTNFDFIASSPLWRCRNTVLPYLKELEATAEIWPELKELYASSIIISPDLPPPPDDIILGAGSLIELPPEDTSNFILRADGNYNFKLPEFPDDHSEKEAETAASKVVIQRVLDMMQERFGASDKSILLVGHGSSGNAILRLITNAEHSGGIDNAGIWMVEEQADGGFDLKIFNDLPEVDGQTISDKGLLPALEPGNTWYHNYFPFEFNAPVISTLGGSISTSKTTPSSAINPGTLVSKFKKDSASLSYIRFELPEKLTSLSTAIFKLRVYAPSEDSSGNDILKLVLQKDDQVTSQYSLSNEISEYNKWVEYTFDLSADSLKDDYYNAVYLYFESDDEVSEGNVSYFDAFQGPKNPLKVTFRVKDRLSDSLLRDVSVIAGQREKLTGPDGEIEFFLTEGKQSVRINHPDYFALDSAIQVSEDTLIQFSLIPEPKSVVFSLVSETNNNPLSDIYAVTGEYEMTTGIDGKAYFHLFKGQYDYSLSHPAYFTTSSSLEVNKDTTVQIILVANKAKIKFRIYSEDYPLNNVAIELDNRILTSNLTGIALFQELTRFELFDWTASKDGFSDLSGTVNLVNDTTLNLNMEISSNNEDHEFKRLKIYPNPVHSILNIDSDQIIRRVEICDLKSAVLFHKDLKSKKVTFDLTGYPDGVYIARIYRDGFRTLNLKVIKTE